MQLCEKIYTIKKITATVTITTATTRTIHKAWWLHGPVFLRREKEDEEFWFSVCVCFFLLLFFIQHAGVFVWQVRDKPWTENKIKLKQFLFIYDIHNIHLPLSQFRCQFCVWNIFNTFLASWEKKNRTKMSMETKFNSYKNVKVTCIVYHQFPIIIFDIVCCIHKFKLILFENRRRIIKTSLKLHYIFT